MVCRRIDTQRQAERLQRGAAHLSVCGARWAETWSLAASTARTPRGSRRVWPHWRISSLRPAQASPHVPDASSAEGIAVWSRRRSRGVALRAVPHRPSGVVTVVVAQ